MGVYWPDLSNDEQHRWTSLITDRNLDLFESDIEQTRRLAGEARVTNPLTFFPPGKKLTLLLQARRAQKKAQEFVDQVNRLDSEISMAHGDHTSRSGDRGDGAWPKEERYSQLRKKHWEARQILRSL